MYPALTSNKVTLWLMNVNEAGYPGDNSNARSISLFNEIVGLKIAELKTNPNLETNQLSAIVAWVSATFDPLVTGLMSIYEPGFRLVIILQGGGYSSQFIVKIQASSPTELEAPALKR